MTEPEPQKLTKEMAAEIVQSIKDGNAIVCYTKCWPCQSDGHFDPPQWHTWADADDIEHARNTSQADPSTSRCGCWCAAARRN